MRRRIARLAERCGAVCLGVCVGSPAGSWSADPRAELRVIADRGAGLIPVWPACWLRRHVRNPPGRQARGAGLRFVSIHQLTAVASGEAARSSRCRPGGLHRGAATRAPRTGGGLGPSSAVGRPSPAVSTVGARRATDCACGKEPVPPGGWGSRERGACWRGRRTQSGACAACMGRNCRRDCP